MATAMVLTESMKARTGTSNGAGVPQGVREPQTVQTSPTLEDLLKQAIAADPSLIRTLQASVPTQSEAPVSTGKPVAKGTVPRGPQAGMSADERAELERLRAFKASADEKKAAKKKPVSFKVSEKGALSVYGLSSRFPFTLYISQWDRLIAAVKDGSVDAFIAEHRSEFAVKED